MKSFYNRSMLNKRVEQALSAARHPRSFEILADVSSHLDRRFAELEQQRRTWEGFQKIITEMGPPSDFTDLIGQDKKSGRWIFTKTELGAISIVLVAFGLSIYYYPQMPERMACHWDIHGQVNGYMPKPMGMLIMPGVLLAIVASFIILPRVVSVWANIEGFRKFYGGFVVLFSIFLLTVQYQMILWNLGIEINPLIVVLAMAPAFIVWIAVWLCRAYRRF